MGLQSGEKREKMSLTAATIVGAVLFLIRAIVLVALLVISGNNGDLMGVGKAGVVGFMALIDLLMIVGCRKRNKLFLLIWLIANFFDICGKVYLCIKEFENYVELGVQIGFIVLILICAVFVVSGFAEIKRREREMATGGTFKTSKFPFIEV